MTIDPRETPGLGWIRKVEVERDPLLVKREARGNTLEQLSAALAGDGGNQQRRGIGCLHPPSLIR